MLKVLSGLVLGASLMLALFVSTRAALLAQDRDRPWLRLKNPVELEWLALQKQADEGDTEFGENGVTVNFYIAGDSYETGIIYCDIDYLPGTSAELVQMIEEGTQKRFAVLRKALPWAKVSIRKQPARPGARN